MYSSYPAPERRGLDVLQALALIGAVALIAVPACQRFGRYWRRRQQLAKTEPAIDKTLADTYPASDPPASRYFDIPVNRR